MNWLARDYKNKSSFKLSHDYATLTVINIDFSAYIMFQHKKQSLMDIRYNLQQYHHLNLGKI